MVGHMEHTCKGSYDHMHPPTIHGRTNGWGRNCHAAMQVVSLAVGRALALDSAVFSSMQKAGTPAGTSDNGG
jgi:hypothetical protein